MDSTTPVYVSRWMETSAREFSKGRPSRLPAALAALSLMALALTMATLGGCSQGATAHARAVDLPYYNSAAFTPHWMAKDDFKLKYWHRTGVFSLTDQHGAGVTDRDIAGKVTVVNFFFPACHGICPTTMRNLKPVQEAFNKDKDVVILSFSLTAATDTPESLKKYAKSRGVTSPNWRLLTGDAQALYRYARTSFFADEDLGKKTADDAFLHTENFFLVDQSGHLRGIYKGALPREVSEMMDDIRTLKKSGARV